MPIKHYLIGDRCLTCDGDHELIGTDDTAHDPVLWTVGMAAATVILAVTAFVVLVILCRP